MNLIIEEEQGRKKNPPCYGKNYWKLSSVACEQFNRSIVRLSDLEDLRIVVACLLTIKNQAAV